MKILMVSEDLPHPSIGGLGRHLLMLARSLSEAGHTLDLMGNNTVPFEAAAAEMPFIGRFYPHLNMRNIGFKEVRMGAYNPVRRPFVAWRFSRAIMRQAKNYDVVHYHGHFPLVANYIPTDVNFVQTLHDQGSDCPNLLRFRNGDICREMSPLSCSRCLASSPNFLQTALSTISVSMYRKLVARAFLRHKAIFVSQALLSNFQRTAGDVEWGTVVHNFIDQTVVDAFSTPATENTGTAEVLIAGRLMESKGIGAFLGELSRRFPPHLRVTVAGDGVDEERLRASYAGDRIVFTGWLSHADTVRLMAKADVIVIPSLVEEAFGLVTLEGLSLGRKVFALDRGATPELKRYERYPGQLSLFINLDQLVEELARIQDTEQVPVSESPAPRLALDAREEVVRVYNRPRVHTS
jgi:glycosyltransferase involved in cell wall biosynthesis